MVSELKQLIEDTTDDWIRSGDARSACAINNGLCADFAEAVQKFFAPLLFAVFMMYRIYRLLREKSHLNL